MDGGRRRAFLRALARSGNVDLAAGRAGIDKQTVYNIRNRDPVFAAAWARAKAWGTARVAARGEAAARDLGSVEGPLHRLAAGHAEAQTAPGSPPGSLGIPRSGEELVVRRSKREGAQVVRAAEGRWSPEADERFMAELRETGNSARAARAAGFSTSALYQRKKRYKDFSARWDTEKDIGCRRVSLMLIAAAEAALDPEVDAEALGLPKVSVSEAIAILRLHHFDRPGAPSRAGARVRAQAVEDMAIEAVRDEVLRRVEAIRRHKGRRDERPQGPLHHAAHGPPPRSGEDV